MRTTPKYLARRQTLDHPDNLRNTVSRHRLNQKMNMIFVRPNLQKFDLVALRNPKTYLFQNLINPIVKYSSTILRRKHQVIQQHRYVMTLMDILAHPQSLRRKRRGIQPKEIQTAYFAVVILLQPLLLQLQGGQAAQHKP